MDLGVGLAPGAAGVGGDSAASVQNQIFGVSAPNAAGATTPVAAPQPAAPALPTPPATQVAMQIVPLRLDADGVHRLTVNLHPADLGPVQVVAEIRNGEIDIQLSGSTDAGTEALREALDDLRRQLLDSGFSNCSLDLRQGSPQQDQPGQRMPARGNAGGSRDLPAAAPVEAAPTNPGGDNGRLDIRA